MARKPKQERLTPEVGDSVYLRGRQQWGWGVIKRIRTNGTWCDMEWKEVTQGITLPRIVHINKLEVKEKAMADPTNKVLQYQVTYADGTKGEPQTFTKNETNDLSRRLTADMERLFEVSDSESRVVAINIFEYPKD